MKKIVKKIFAIMIIFTLVYSNGILTINAIVNSITTHATDIEDVLDEQTNQQENQEETPDEVPSEEQTEEIGTKAELGINVEEMSTTLENNIQFTISLFTNSDKYDLYKNPKFLIELPECIETINTINKDDITLLNNKKQNVQEEEDIFSNLEIEQFKEDGKQYIRIILTGEQEEYNESAINNTQIIVPAVLKTSDLLPTLDEEVRLYYFNENRTEYCIPSDTKMGYGEFVKPIKFVAATGILTETTINVGDKTVRNLKGESKSLSLPTVVDNQGTVKITIVNNTGEDLENINILGSSALLNQISIQEAEVKYSTNENPSINDEEWTAEYREGMKNYLIKIESFAQGQSVEFSYNISIPGTDIDKVYEEKYQVLTSSNVELTKQNSNIDVKPLTSEIETDVMKMNLYANAEKNSLTQTVAEIGAVLEYGVSLKNKEQDSKNVTVIAELPDNIDQESINGRILVEDRENGFWIPEENIDITISNNLVTITAVLNANEEKYVEISAVIDKYTTNEVEGTIKVIYDDEEYILRDLKNALSPSNISIEKEVYKNDIPINNGKLELSEEDELVYILKISNTGETSEQIRVLANISNLLKVTSVEYISAINHIVWDEESLTNNFSISRYIIGGTNEDTIIIKAKLLEALEETSNIVSTISVTGEYMEPWETTIEHRVEIENSPGENPEDPTQPQNPEDPTQPQNPDDTGENNPDDTENQEPSDNPEEQKNYYISGMAWLDLNKNGARDVIEPALTKIGVQLVKNDEIISQTITDNDGKYKFQNIASGEYVIIFNYDTSTYKLTTPKQSGISDTINSDAYEVNTDGKNITKTDKLSLIHDIENIDIGLVEKGKFDFKLEKRIHKITLNNNEGKKVLNYKDEELAKIEIPAKYFVGSNIIIEYSITVKNIGEIAGYVYSLADIKPEGTEFISDLNPDWYEQDGKLYSVSLTEQKIEPGETASLTLVLTKEIKEDEALTIKNKAEIFETFNEELQQETDLTDNYSKAEVVISIKTGNVKTYIVLIIATLSIIGVGSYVIKKKVLS